MNSPAPDTKPRGLFKRRGVYGSILPWLPFLENLPKRGTAGSDDVYKDHDFTCKRNQTNIHRLVKDYFGEAISD